MRQQFALIIETEDYCEEPQIKPTDVRAAILRRLGMTKTYDMPENVFEVVRVDDIHEVT